jgi:hypothetical protein
MEWIVVALAHVLAALKQSLLFLDKAVHEVHKDVLVHKVQQEQVRKVYKVLLDQLVLVEAHREPQVLKELLVLKEP